MRVQQLGGLQLMFGLPHRDLEAGPQLVQPTHGLSEGRVVRGDVLKPVLRSLEQALALAEVGQAHGRRFRDAEKTGALIEVSSLSSFPTSTLSLFFFSEMRQKKGEY